MRQYIIAMKVSLQDYQDPGKWLVGTMGSVMMTNIEYTVEEIKDENKSENKSRPKTRSSREIKDNSEKT